jgi:hypothetical protein
MFFCLLFFMSIVAGWYLETRWWREYVSLRGNEQQNAGEDCITRIFVLCTQPAVIFFFLWRYSPNSGVGLPPWNSPFHFSLLHLGQAIVVRPLPVHKHRKTHARTHTNKHQTSMPWVGREPMIPASERAKTVHASDRSATVTSASCY